MTLTAQLSKLFTAGAVPLDLDLTIPWDQQPDYLELTAQVTAATLVFNDCQTKLNWCESICDPHRNRWITRDVSELEQIRAHHERPRIKEAFMAAQYTKTDLLARQQTLGARIRTTMSSYSLAPTRSVN